MSATKSKSTFTVRATNILGKKGGDTGDSTDNTKDVTSVEKIVKAETFEEALDALDKEARDFVPSGCAAYTINITDNESGKIISGKYEAPDTADISAAVRQAKKDLKSGKLEQLTQAEREKRAKEEQAKKIAAGMGR